MMRRRLLRPYAGIWRCRLIDLGTYAAWKATKTTGQFDLKTFEVKATPLEKVTNLRPGMSVIIKK